MKPYDPLTCLVSEYEFKKMKYSYDMLEMFFEMGGFSKITELIAHPYHKCEPSSDYLVTLRLNLVSLSFTIMECLLPTIANDCLRKVAQAFRIFVKSFDASIKHS